ncbi:MAG TPA: hypothetical protein VME86_08510 [Acidobacteriaceae bacterium]|nr:hypothetical protein [Acidobacteriaceae bacterium]
MDSISLRDPQVIGAITAAGLCVAGVIVWAVTRKRPTEEELERMRREHLVKTGRIIDGTILDTSEIPDTPEIAAMSEVKGDGSSTRGLEPMQLIQYKYEIAGVVYECSQDVTHLKDYVNIRECRLSFPCSVRYEPKCPSNSIVVAETWSGLRDTANSVPVHPMHLAVRKAQASTRLHG